jgi:hypothetical protein
MREEQPHGTLPLYLTRPEAQRIAAGLQESRRIESSDDGLAGVISPGSFADQRRRLRRPRC